MPSNLRSSSGLSPGTVTFILCINDLPNYINRTVKLYADDALVYRPIRNNDDIAHLQDDLNELEVWSNKWQMLFNPFKCEHLP